ncbi:MAG: M23 family metallopeptidase, partial [Leptospiraceae bacterium]|nr:M23 family metallopeptidase [Leptospiraceae bacterium]
MQLFYELKRFLFVFFQNYYIWLEFSLITKVFSLLFLLISSPTFSHDLNSRFFHSPISQDFFLHPGEGFCDEMYYFSYNSRKYHSGEDYILKWKEKDILTNLSFNKLFQYQKKHFHFIPTEAEFWKTPENRIDFLKINLYRAGLDIIDTKLGLYPKTNDDKYYGYGEPIYAIYDAVVEASLNPTTPKGWGKTILLKHILTGKRRLHIKWKGRNLKLKYFYSQYSHLKENYLSVNQKVVRGEKIGEVGDANGIFNSLNGIKDIREGAHLHFEIRFKKADIVVSKEILSNKEKI